MDEIFEFKIHQLKKFAFIEYSEDFMELAQACESVTQNMAQQLARLQAAYNQVLALAQKSFKSDLTDPIFVLDTQEYEAGEVISAPAAPSGYEWEDFPYRMPANDITVNAVRKNIPGGGGGSGFE